MNLDPSRSWLEVLNTRHVTGPREPREPYWRSYARDARRDLGAGRGTHEGKESSKVHQALKKACNTKTRHSRHLTFVGSQRFIARSRVRQKQFGRAGERSATSPLLNGSEELRCQDRGSRSGMALQVAASGRRAPCLEHMVSGLGDGLTDRREPHRFKGGEGRYEHDETRLDSAHTRRTRAGERSR